MGEFIVQDQAGIRRVAIGRQMTIGRGSSNELVLKASFASRRHARVWRQGDRVIIEDLTSTNGTFVNGQRLERPRFLNHNDVIMIGDGHLRFVVSWNSSEATTPPQGVPHVMASQIACAECGAVNPPHAQVCAHCGRGLDAGSLQRSIRSPQKGRAANTFTPTEPVVSRPFPVSTVAMDQRKSSGAWLVILLLSIVAVAFLTILAVLVLYVVS